MTPSIGRILRYCLDELDADAINRRRTTPEKIRSAIVTRTWHRGIQAHLGDPVHAGDVFPMIVVKAHLAGLDENRPEWRVSGQVFLDGTDTLHVQAVKLQPVGQTIDAGTCGWPPGAKPSAPEQPSS